MFTFFVIFLLASLASAISYLWVSGGWAVVVFLAIFVGLYAISFRRVPVNTIAAPVLIDKNRPYDVPSGWHFFLPVVYRLVPIVATEQNRNLEVELEAGGGVSVRFKVTVFFRVTKAWVFFKTLGVTNPVDSKVINKIEAILRAGFIDVVSRHDIIELVPIANGPFKVDDSQPDNSGKRSRSEMPYLGRSEILAEVMVAIQQAIRMPGGVRIPMGRFSENTWLEHAPEDPHDAWGFQIRFTITDPEEASGEMRKATEELRRAQQMAKAAKISGGAILEEVAQAVPGFADFTEENKIAALVAVAAVITAQGGGSLADTALLSYIGGKRQR